MSIKGIFSLEFSYHFPSCSFLCAWYTGCMSGSCRGVGFRTCSVWGVGNNVMAVSEVNGCSDRSLVPVLPLMGLSLLGTGAAQQLSNAHVCIHMHMCFYCVCFWSFAYIGRGSLIREVCSIS